MRSEVFVMQKTPIVSIVLVSALSLFLLYIFINGAIWDLLGLVIVIGIIIGVLVLYIIGSYMKPTIKNPKFNGQHSRIDENSNEIVLCSIEYPADAYDGKVWIVSNNSITIIDKDKNKTILFSAISSMELRQISPLAGSLSCKKILPWQFGGVSAEHADLATITFSSENSGIAQAIHDRISLGIESSPERLNAPSNPRLEALKSLKDLLDDGVLTQSEFDSEKSKILNDS